METIGTAQFFEDIDPVFYNVDGYKERSSIGQVFIGIIKSEFNPQPNDEFQIAFEKRGTERILRIIKR